MLTSTVPADLPMSSGVQTKILAEFPNVGAGRHSTTVGPGIYTFNWWLNLPDSKGRRLMPSAPEDTIVACGHWGRDVIMIIPSLDLVAAWSRSRIRDFLNTEGKERTEFDQATQIVCDSVTDPKL
jgi:hypothetical protein